MLKTVVLDLNKSSGSPIHCPPQQGSRKSDRAGQLVLFSVLFSDDVQGVNDVLKRPLKSLKDILKSLCWMVGRFPAGTIAVFLAACVLFCVYLFWFLCLHACLPYPIFSPFLTCAHLFHTRLCCICFFFGVLIVVLFPVFCFIFSFTVFPLVFSCASFCLFLLNKKKTQSVCYPCSYSLFWGVGMGGG